VHIAGRPARPHLLSYRALRVVFHFHLDRRRRRLTGPRTGPRINRTWSILYSADAGRSERPRGRILMTLLSVVVDDGKTTAIIVEDRADELGPRRARTRPPQRSRPARPGGGCYRATRLHRNSIQISFIITMRLSVFSEGRPSARHLNPRSSSMFTDTILSTPLQQLYERKRQYQCCAII